MSVEHEIGSRVENRVQSSDQTFESRLLSKLAENANKNDFTFKGVVGEGQFRKLYLATRVSDKKEYVVKAVDKKSLAKTGDGEIVSRELQVIANLSHPFLISCPYHFEDSCHVYLVMPYISGGDVYSYIMWSGRTPSEEIARFFSAQILLALEYLHGLRIVHRDLKPENLMIDEQGFLKLIDFGFCTALTDRSYTICGTRQYMAPEMLLGEGYDCSVDYWSLGVLAYELNSFQLPFDSDDPIDLSKKIISGRFIFPGTFGADLRDLVQHLLVVNPQLRYTSAGQLKEHKWFHQIDFERLYLKKVTPPYVPSNSRRSSELTKEDRNVKNLNF